jgi:hypothetical protein
MDETHDLRQLTWSAEAHVGNHTHEEATTFRNLRHLARLEANSKDPKVISPYELKTTPTLPAVGTIVTENERT